ncbi:cell division protein CrgA [Nocardioides pantholopis]|uniref:cell division protein CrgA n=1 Tax=Nocardioides pantholopis TaxID=2483798 RepID=UPI001F14B7CE|nr:cell division protein CrgA [Nocardioides pantholopis]
MTKSKADQRYVDPTGSRVFSVRFLISLLMMAAGIAWTLYYYVAVWADPTDPEAKAGKPAFMADLGDWNYLIGFGLLMLGLAVAAHPSTPLGRGQGVVVGMLGCFLIGLIWICLFYIFSDDLSALPVFDDLGQKNLFVGIGFMAVGFAYATKWE